MSEPSPLAERLVAALGSYDAEALEPLLAPDVRHWVNISQQEQAREQLLAQIAVERRAIAQSKFTLRDHVATADGFVLQLVVSGTTTSGVSFKVPVCLVVRCRDEQVVRIDEYASLNHARPILEAMTGGA